MKTTLILYVLGDTLKVNVLPEYTDEDINAFIDDLDEEVQLDSVMIFPYEDENSISVAIEIYTEEMNK